MPIPLFRSLADAQATILKRVPFDEVEVTDALLDGIEQRVGERIHPAALVERIVTDVRERGDVAVREWSLRLDGSAAPAWQVPPERLLAAWQAQPADLHAALQLAAEQIPAFHQIQH